MGKKQASEWFLKEHLAAKQKSNKWLEGKTGWTHRITNDLINRNIRFNSDHLAAVAEALEIEPFEIMLHPADAAEIKRIRADYYRELQAAAARRMGFDQDEPAPSDDNGGNIHSIHRIR
jgi:hypothetical protein